jgi:uncharacterized protein
MASGENAFQVFVKPAGARCNLNCSYCYYTGKDELIRGDSPLLMNDDILERYISSHFDASDEETIIFSWHGGEPTLAGTGFYRKAISFQEKYNIHGRQVLNGIQTNATLIDEEWCSFFKEHNFFAGVSIDGPENLHDRFRKHKTGTGSFSQTLRGYNLLKKHGIPTEILSVVNNINVKFPLEVYRFLKSLGTEFITFIPLVEKDSSSLTGAGEDSVTSADFGNFLCAVFDEWVENDIGQIKIQIFEEALRTAFNQDHTLCIFKKRCGRVPVIERNGNLYSCDHFVDNEHLVGNIKQLSVRQLLDSDIQIKFGAAKYDTLPQYCLSCEVIDMCNGECPKNRFINTPSGEPGLNYLCAGYKKFFNHIGPFAEAVKNEWNQDIS